MNTYKPGDPVRDIRCDTIPGRFVDLYGQIATVRWEGKIVDSEIYIGDLRPETVEETAKREYIEAYRAWCARQPMARRVGVRWNNVAVYMGDVSTPEAMRQAAVELMLFADWFAEKPAEAGSR